MSDIVVIQQPTTQLKIEGHGGVPGAAGPTGATGPTGSAGPPGGPWYTGTANPNGSVSASANDMFLRTDNGDVYQCNGSTSWTLKGNIKGATGATGSAGANGTRGSLWTSGTGVPSAANNSGDMYLRTATNIGDVYEGAGGTTWNLTGNIRGPAGADGATGATGATGPAGNPNIFYNTNTADVSWVSTTDVNVVSISGLTAGTYMFDMDFKWDAGDAVATSYTVTYSGTFTAGSSTFEAVRIASSVNHSTGNAFNTLIGTSGVNPNFVIARGVLVATGTGNLTLSARRASGGTTTCPKGGAHLIVRK